MRKIDAPRAWGVVLHNSFRGPRLDNVADQIRVRETGSYPVRVRIVRESDWRKLMRELRKKDQAIKCDGNHGAPPCADKECWHK